MSKRLELSQEADPFSVGFPQMDRRMGARVHFESQAAKGPADIQKVSEIVSRRTITRNHMLSLRSIESDGSLPMTDARHLNSAQ